MTRYQAETSLRFEIQAISRLAPSERSGTLQEATPNIKVKPGRARAVCASRPTLGGRECVGRVRRPQQSTIARGALCPDCWEGDTMRRASSSAVVVLNRDADEVM